MPKEPKLPNKIRILGIDYEVKQQEGVDLEDNPCCGLAKSAEGLIIIEKDMLWEAKIGTLIHEIIEVLNYRLELRLKHHQISTLDAGLTQILFDNKEMFK